LRRAVVPLTGVVAAAPVILSAIRAVVNDWAAVGDQAVIAARAYDVLSTHPPLLGQFSASSGVAGESSHSLGPMLYWVLALPARLGGVAPALAIALVNVACVMGAVALARRRGGYGLMAATATAILVMSASLASVTYSDIWNPSAGLLALLLLVFLAWSLACGELWALPLSVVVASYVVQCHLTYFLPAIGTMAIGIAGLVLAQRRARAPLLRRWVVAALLVGLVCWAAPIAEQLTHDPGNLVAIGRAAQDRGDTLGPSAGWHALARTVGVRPWWLTAPRRPFDRLTDVARVPWLTTASAILLLAALLVAAVLGLRRRRREVTYACALALVLCLGVALVAAATPSSGLLFISIGYTLWWASVAGMFAWLVLGWSLVTLSGISLRARPALAALPVAGALVFALAADPGENIQEPLYRPMRSIAARLPTANVVEVQGASKTLDHRFDFAAGSVYALRRRGAQPIAVGMDQLFGRWYAPRGRAPASTVRMACRTAPGRVLERVPEPGPCPVVVTLTSP
jgi:hypothetical protein